MRNQVTGLQLRSYRDTLLNTALPTEPFSVASAVLPLRIRTVARSALEATASH